MKAIEPGLLDKLFDDAPKSPVAGNVFKAVSIDQYKESIARDLEGLLNSRAAYDLGNLEEFPECQKSLMTYGLGDFSAMSLANGYDRARICRMLEQAVARHEQRLRDVRVELESDSQFGGGLHFTIHAVLELEPAREPISFDAILQPSTLQYSVGRFRRQA